MIQVKSCTNIFLKGYIHRLFRFSKMEVRDGPWYSCEYQQALMMVADSAGDPKGRKYIRQGI